MDLGEVSAVTPALTIPQVLRAYRTGMFPMGLGERGAAPYGWWSPHMRGVLEPGRLKITKSLRKSVRRFSWSCDLDFDGVIRGCADPRREGAWIDEEIIAIYSSLHSKGIAHSIEVWEDQRLVGGLYGLALGSLFAGESMFHRATDASKVALVHLVELLDGVASGRPWLIDTQWSTPHLATLGVSEIPRLEYERRLPALLGGIHSQGFLKN
ncbi:leucyl/phenylalanyl-tRNA--protein transferase [Brevibacterium sp. 50QC2O2]|jgi:leucyl/phenylalanyl-tRNA--protein transferase|uniref:leucyl/phenylalanyl-tRNA--protein transferase n=1 Tax=unclassified Brevibacterium TaxID=2614124 RepID=UPI00211C7D11|nr:MULTISPECIES: leucyl/phenylalanyl-tRNA--protein transferase [unclassified Brevibacterium]MCQ9366684.1 leucyl/phenylalanyl-tRNA--protein transferase [Brevibacterium sp. 91QC2O2]MCQ9388958.1 leucyl/phenylalanyl-tRNA--protein transferase [Brevibacterium sp. 50QC2O2]